MPVKTNREYRSMENIGPADDEYIVEGYATTFNDPYELAEFDGVSYREMVDSKAFDGADMNDVIMQYDHSGKVFARQSNGTLQLMPDEHGLKIRADLSKSAAARDLYEEIKAGLITKMSWAFVVDGENYDNSTHTRNITKVKKIYDVSAVSLPANPDTDISARTWIDGAIETERRESAERERRIKKIRILMEVNTK